MALTITTTQAYFSLVLLALVDAEYRFPWVNVESSGSSDAQIFNNRDLREKIEDGTSGLPQLNYLGRICTISCWVVPNDNYRNPSTDAKHQRELLKDYCNQVGDWLGRMTGSEMCQPDTLGPEEADIYQSF